MNHRKRPLGRAHVWMGAWILLVGLAACNLPTPLPSAASTPTALPPSPAQPPSSTTATVNLTSPAAQSVSIFLVALEDNGATGPKIGCNDSLVAVPVRMAPTQAVLRAALEQLLSLKTAYYGQSGLYHALYRSDLAIEDLSIQDGEAMIHLKGQLVLGGECDDPRVKAQLEATARQFSTVKQVSIFINGVPLDQVLSAKE